MQGETIYTTDATSVDQTITKLQPAASTMTSHETFKETSTDNNYSATQATTSTPATTTTLTATVLLETMSPTSTNNSHDFEPPRSENVTSRGNATWIVVLATLSVVLVIVAIVVVLYVIRRHHQQKAAKNSNGTEEQVSVK